MVMTLDDSKRTAIAIQLAEIKVLQNLLIENDRILLDAAQDDKIRQLLQEMLEQDQKNLDVLETTIIQYGIQSEPRETVRQQFDDLQQWMRSSDLTLFEKVSQQELLKHEQAMTGLILHKAAQRVGSDIEAAIAPLHTLNFENRAQQEQFKGVLERLGVVELTGEEPDQGLWARGEDTIAALTGVVGSVVTRTDDEMSIRDVLLMDHSKTDILFAEILGSDDPQKIEELFEQLYQDVKVHGLAEEDILYPALSPYYDQMQEIVDQTDRVIEMLDEMKPLNPADSHFKTQIEQLRLAVREHINQEESDIFPRIREHLSHEQQKQMATDFKAAKSRLQKQQQEQNPPSSQQPPMSHSTSHNPSSDRIKPWFILMKNTLPWKQVFQTKAAINWVEAAIFLIGDRWIREFLNTEPLVNPEYSQLVYGLVFIIGIGYWWVSQDITQNHAIIKLGIYAQFSVFLILAYHTLIGGLHPLYLLSGVFDLTFAILFSLFLYTYNRAEGRIGTSLPNS